MPRKLHYGRSQKFKTVRIVAYRTRGGQWHKVENVYQEKVSRYPSNRAVEKAKTIVIGGEYEYRNSAGVWVRADDIKYLTTFTPFTQTHTIDDFANEAMRSEDYAPFRWI